VPTSISSSPSEVSPGVGEVGAVLAAADDTQSGGEDEEKGLEDITSDCDGIRRVDENFRHLRAFAAPKLNHVTFVISGYGYRIPSLGGTNCPSFSMFRWRCC
jgi:hypothetical protein